jgi:putative spermidine/putrescine transport system permease protein
MLVLLPFFVAPLLVVGVASVLETDGFGGLLPTFTLQNYVDVLTSSLTFNLYWATVKFAVLTWFFTLVIGFFVAYFLVFHVKNQLLAISLFLICTVPFWTSNIIRMISWRPVLGREGLINDALLSLGLVGEPLEWLLFSDFAVVVAYVHLFTLFMIVPIFNAMARIDPALLEAAVDAGATRFGVIWNVVLPLSKTGIALGALFVTALVMGDFFVVKVMSGGLSGSATSGMSNDIQFLNYPRAAANAVILLVVVMMFAAAIFRFVDVRKELAR